MKFSNNKFLLLVGSLAVLFTILAIATWNINRDSGASSLVQKTASGTLHGSAEGKTSTELSDSFMKRMGPLMKIFEDRMSLLADTVRMNASAGQTSSALPNSNSYLSFSTFQVNTYQDLLHIKVRINALQLAKDFADKACPVSPAVLSGTSSGGIITPEALRVFLVHYYIQSNATSSPVHFTVKSFPFGSLSELSKEMFVDGTLSLINMPAGTYTITAIPGCMSMGGTSELYPNAIIQDTFEKKVEPLDIYSEESNTDALLKILSPGLDTKTPGKAIREIPYTTSSQEKATSEKLAIPYIQTETTLQVKAESIVPQGALNASGSVIEEKKYFAQFALYNKNNVLVATTESQKVLSPAKSTKITWHGTFYALPKGEYTLITRLIAEKTDADNTTQEILKRSRVGSIGIGDIYIALGDKTLTGYDGETWSDMIGNDSLEGRNKAQPSKECEVASFFKSPCKSQTRLYYGLTSTLSEDLTEKKNYPVFILNEGMPESITLDKMAAYIGGTKTGLRDRYALVNPTGILLQISASTVPDQAKNNMEEMRKIFISLKEAISSLKESKDIPVYYAVPQYEVENSLSETFALEFKNFISRETGYFTGPNLYKLFLEKLLSEKSANLYRQNADEKVYVNDLGLKEVAAKWINYIN